MKTKEIKQLLIFFKKISALKTTRRFSASLKKGDSVAEHSWQLALMVIVLAKEYKLNIDLAKTINFVLIHDLPEAITGDLDGYLLSSNQTSLAIKEKKEQKAIREITKNISFGKWISDLWNDYQKQECVEAKLVKALDKIEAYLHIDETGVESYSPKVFYSNYADKAVNTFDKTTNDFPKLKDLLEAIKKDLQKKFKNKGINWKK